MVKIAINGFGRIGRMVYRIASERQDIEIVAINDLTDAVTLAHLLKYDTVHGEYEKEVEAAGDTILVDQKPVKVFALRDPKELPWGELGIDVVVESTGFFTDGTKAQAHIEAGAKKVIISAPATNEDLTLVLGINENQYDSSKHTIISNGSCTTNALAPLVKVLEDSVGIESAFMNTVHSYTNDQKLLDLPHSDLRRARAAAQNIIPTSTGAAKAIYKVVPSVKGKIDGLAVRVPTKDASLIDLTVNVGKETTVEEINQLFKDAADNELKGILAYTDKPLVSNDYIGNSHSSTFDSLLTQVVQGKMVKVLAWYDNEFGFSTRVVDEIQFLADKGI